MVVSRGALPNDTELSGLFMKAIASMVFTELGIDTLVILLPSKPLSPSSELGSTTAVSRLFAKALWPIVLTELPSVRLESLLLVKASFAILVTESGITRLPRELPLNALSPNETKELGKVTLVSEHA